MQPECIKQKLYAVPFTDVSINDNFWAPRLKTHKDITLKVCIDQCEKTGRISNFDKASGQTDGQFCGRFYNDSDVYKVLEGAAYSLMNNPDPGLEARIDEIIGRIADAQDEDGYLMTYFQLAEPGRKWTDMGMHETYCAGHLIEAAIAYRQATGKDKFFKVACKLADHIRSLFGPGKKHWVPGHEEIELALVKLFRETGNAEYLNLAHWFLEERGHGHTACKDADEGTWNPAYNQDDKPVRKMDHVSGHAVRAMYLYSAMADIASMLGEKEYTQALEKIWKSVVLRNMYITGGIGSSKDNEGFTEDYDLPNDTAYCETCASVGMVYWNHRMNLLHGDGKYADVYERSMYNGALAGISFAGSRFFYVNPLESDGTRHRVEWFNTSCCPTQLERFIPSIGNYIYASSDEGIWVNLYIQCSVRINIKGIDMMLDQVTNYPWDGRVRITVNAAKTSEFQVNLRLPEWCGTAGVRVNGTPVSRPVIEKGYIKLRSIWEKGDVIDLNLDMPVQIVKPDPMVRCNAGKIAIQRGPLVYCIEETDNKYNYDSMALSSEARFEASYHPEIMGGVTFIDAFEHEKKILSAIPYCLWDNREKGRMKVWIPQK